MSKFTKVVDVLKVARDHVQHILTAPEDEMHRMRIASILEKEVDRIQLLTGSGDLLMDEIERPGPATTVAGKPLKVGSGLRVNDIAAEEKEVEVLRRKIEHVYGIFLKTDSKDLLKNYDPLVIRGVAKKAHMKVTRDEPAVLTIDFINKIKEELKVVQEKENESWAENRKLKHEEQLKRIPADQRAQAEAEARAAAEKEAMERGNRMFAADDEKPAAEPKKTPAEEHQDDNKTPHAEPTKPEEHKIAPLPEEKSPIKNKPATTSTATAKKK